MVMALLRKSERAVVHMLKASLGLMEIFPDDSHCPNSISVNFHYRIPMSKYSQVGVPKGSRVGRAFP